MGKPTGFLEYQREESKAASPKARIKNYNEFHTPLSMEQRRQQGARCMDCGVPFCQSGMMIGKMTSGCPLNNLIPEWNDLVYNQNMEQAYHRLKKTNNFPEFTSRVCPALCEAACTCGVYDSAVTVKENEYAICEYAYEAGYANANPPKLRTGKTIAVIGSGPSGLAAADQLNKRGHKVTVYERSDRPGGLLMYGIPNMKLEKNVIERKIDIMKQEGIEFITSTNVGVDISSKELLSKYDRVVLACGASKPRDIQVNGRKAEGIYFAVDYLKSTTKSLLDNDLKPGTFISASGKKVVVVGGGDTGNDCVATAIRQQASMVTQLEMMPKAPEKRLDSNPWPQWPKVLKTDYGQEEAIEVFGHDPRVYETTVKEFIADKSGKLKQMVTIAFDAKTMKTVPGTEKTIDCDMVLIAAGFLGTEDYITDAFGLERTQRNNVATKDNEYATNVSKVFVAGDMHRGQSLVVWAIYEGRNVAKAVDESLMGYSNMV